MSKVAVVTGASKGIGKAIAVQLVQSGYEVHGVYNTSKDEADTMHDECGVIFHQADLSNRAKTQKLAEELTSLQNVCSLVNDAGIWVADDLDTINYGNWDKTLEVNLTAPLILSLALGRVMQAGGSIVNSPYAKSPS